MIDYSDIYDPEIGFDAYLSNLTAVKLSSIYEFNNKKILDIGSGTGLISEYFANQNQITIVEKNYEYIQILKEKFNPKEIIQKNFMDADIDNEYDFIFIFNNIQEQENIDLFLNKATKNLSSSGSIFITYPNVLSIHRIIAKGLGIIDDIYSSQSSNSRKYGDFHLLSRKEFNRKVLSMNLKIKYEDGIFFKPFTNEYLDKFSIDQLNFLNEFSKIYPDNCALNFLEITK